MTMAASDTYIPVLLCEELYQSISGDWNVSCSFECLFHFRHNQFVRFVTGIEHTISCKRKRVVWERLYSVSDILQPGFVGSA